MKKQNVTGEQPLDSIGEAVPEAARTMVMINRAAEVRAAGRAETSHDGGPRQSDPGVASIKTHHFIFE